MSPIVKNKLGMKFLIIKNIGYLFSENSQYDVPDFTYSSHSNDRGRIMYFDKNHTKYFHRKHIFLNILSDHDVSCCPKTYFSYQEFKDYEQI